MCIRDSRLTVAAAGDISAQDLGLLLDKLLSDLPATGLPMPGRAALHVKSGIKVQDFPGPQSVVIFGPVSYTHLDVYKRQAADRLDLMMKMESNRMRNLLLTEEDVTTERQVILEERAQRTDSDPGALLGEQMQAAQFLNHPYGRPIIGWRHEVSALSRQNALDFYQANYAPNNAILVVAGDVDPKAVFELAKTYYGPVAPSDHITPVSYTHLDVYKRQNPHQAAAFYTDGSRREGVALSLIHI